jgi:ABC-type branched-subunit amino acid transport system ATPase component
VSGIQKTFDKIKIFHTLEVIINTMRTTSQYINSNSQQENCCYESICPVVRMS